MLAVPHNRSPRTIGEPSAGWVRVVYPDRFGTRPAQLEDLCGWKTRRRGGSLEACLVETYRRQPPSLLRLSRLTNAADADRSAAFQHIGRWPKLDALTSELRPMTQAELRRLLSLESREGFWAAFQLDMQTAPDLELASRLQDWYRSMTAELPDSSLWVVDFDRWFSSRQSVVRSLFAASEAPEVLNRPSEQFAGFPAARGLMTGSGWGIVPALDLPLIVAAPWVFGITTTRIGAGTIVVLFGRPEAGRQGAVAGELLQLYRPYLLSSPIRNVMPQPRVTAVEIECLLRWWVGRLNELFGVVLDPAIYQDDEGTYNVQNHLGALLSMDRLLACVLEILIHSRRDEFIRKLLLFEVLDLLEGFGVGGYDQLCNPTFVQTEVDRLAAELPAEVANLILPRCRRASDALRDLQDGFYLNERRRPGSMKVPDKSGKLQIRPMATAVSQYLRVVRNAGHGFGEMVRERPHQVSLLATHTGELPPELSDLAFVHLLRVLADPVRLVPGKVRRRRYGTTA
jgi:hypothetical protein